MGSIREAKGSRAFKYDGISSTFQYLYNLRGYGSEGAAFLAMAAGAPAAATVNDIDLKSRSLAVKPRGNAALGNYLGVADYRHVSRTPSRDAPEKLGDQKKSFQFTMPRPFFTQAISQDKFGDEARDVGLAINVLEDGTVEGFEIDVPSDGLQVSTRLNIGGADPAAVNNWLKSRIAQLGTKNAAPFLSWEKGDCLFRSFSGAERSDGDFDIQWDIAVVAGEDYGSKQYDTGLVQFNLGTRVAGFDLIWTQYAQFEDTAAKLIVPKARGAYVAKVFKDSDFDLFGVV